MTTDLQYYNGPALDILNIAAFLDPCFKSNFLEEVDKVSTCLTVQEKIVTNCNLLLDSISDHPSGAVSTEPTSNSEVNIVSSESSDVTPAAKRTKQSKFMKLLSDICNR